MKSITEEGTFSGYASVFNHVDHDNDLIKHGAFERSLFAWKEQKQWPKMLWQHQQHRPIGQWLDIKEDDYGLYVKGKILLNIQDGHEAYAMLKNGIVDGLSIGFTPKKRKLDSSFNHYVLDDIDLHEISLVTFAANSHAKVTWVKTTKQNISERLACIERKIQHLTV